MADLMSLDRPESPAGRPQPRPVRSPARSAQIRIQNRRRAYLDKNPDYFRSLEHELIRYCMIPSFVASSPQKSANWKDGKRVVAGARGRPATGEAKLSQLKESSASNGQESASGQPSSSRANSTAAAATATTTTLPAGLGEVLLQDEAQTSSKPESQEEGQQRWDDFIRNRFILGRDEDFDYGPVDGNDAFDEMERQDEEEAWFGDEEPSWIGEEGEDEPAASKDKSRLQGETGLQDF
ncbi:uncharacterized protein PG986_010781 [Apiospora aurea]|uniref:CCD97-like C-terminal domain-containing protein n=1 Tax=Apiospora aurea TaxID=335848 RepID=A0ABR1Q398_9PEZI